MLSTRVLFYYILFVIIVIASLLANSWYTLLYTIPVLVFLWYSQITTPKDLKVSVTRKMRERTLFAGDSTTVRLTVKNLDDKPVNLEVVDTLPLGSRVISGSNKVCTVLRPGEEITVEYSVEFPLRGHYTIGPTRVSTSDPAGIAELELIVENEDYITVFPKFEPIKTVYIRPRYTGVWPGFISTRRSGLGSEFYGVRDYIPGDDLRRINWKVSARRGKLASNEYESENVTDAVVVLDTTGLESLGEYLTPVLEAMVSAAASLAYSLITQGNRVGLLVHGRYKLHVNPGFGKKQFLRILHYLADVKPGAAMMVDQVVTFMLPYMLRPQAQVIVISPMLDINILYALRELAGLEYSIIIVSPDPYSLPAKSKAEEIAFRIMSLERLNKIEKVKEYCAVIDWKLTASLEEVLKRYRWVCPHITTRR
ncbi:MAG: hypothetical protein DRJ52_07895 [Thermoprotei archaeon]|nr:MAG: hypothetical protein DRJ52_07895 [Thermoprotei archaeon]RLE99722.1 MAG: hypothetical protein DRJ63_04485 [Thermoprotei archaeon]HDI75509.1 DUF58 domain-containing protein [Thermoprotei archaeon]